MAPSTAAVEITDIFNDIITNNLRYCAICLRTEQERMLVEPNSYMKCLSILNLKDPVVTTLCYVCESQARRALTLLRAVTFTAAVNDWFKDMASKLRYMAEMPSDLDRYMKIQARKGLPPLSRAWKELRSQMDLVQTEVLVVGDEYPTEVGGDVVVTVRPGDTSPEADDTLILPHDSDNMKPDLVVVVDDEEPPGVVLRNQLSIPNPVRVYTAPPVGMGLVIQQTMACGMLVPTVGTDTQIITLSGTPTWQPNTVSTVCTPSWQADPLCVPYSNDIGVPEVAGGVRGGSEAKQPVMSSRVDWEDKIPMDVISFVDVADPSTQVLFEQPKRKRQHDPA